MRRLLHVPVIAVVLFAAPLLGQGVREIPFESSDPLKFPDNIHLGEVAGVATNSKGDVFVYTRTGHPVISIGTARAFTRGGSRMFHLDKTGKYVREIGQDSYAFLMAQQLRVDPQDNVWAVDQMSNTVMKFDPAGQIVLLLGRKAEAERVPAPAVTGVITPAGLPGAAAPPAAGGGGRAAGAPAAGAEVAAARAVVALLLLQQHRRAEARAAVAAVKKAAAVAAAALRAQASLEDLFIRPTDVAWDATGNIYVADGLGNNSRVAKFDKDGKFVKSWGSTGTANGQFNMVTGIAIDAQGSVYVADKGNKRIQVFDREGTFKSQITNIGAPSALCITSGPHQYLYASNSNPPENIDADGEIYKLELDGKILGKFGRAGKLPKEFGTVNSIDCRTENDLYVGEIGNWRVQKLTLKP